MRPLWVLAVVLRLALVFGAGTVASTLGSRIEVTTPVSSLRVLNEGLFLLHNRLALYNGGAFVQAPLLLAVFHLIPPVLVPLLFVALDIAIACGITCIAVFKHNRDLALGLIPEVAVVSSSRARSNRIKSPIRGGFSRVSPMRGSPPRNVAANNPYFYHQQQQIQQQQQQQTRGRQFRLPTEEDFERSNAANAFRNANDTPSISVQGSSPVAPEMTHSESVDTNLAHISSDISPSASIDGLSKRMKRSTSANSIESTSSAGNLLPASNMSRESSSNSVFHTNFVFHIEDEFYPSEVLGDRYVPLYLRFEPSDIGAIYLMSPLSVLPCVGGSLAVLENFCVVMSFTFAVHRKLLPAIAMLMFAVHMSVYPLVFFLPLLALYRPHYKRYDLIRAIIYAIGIQVAFMFLSAAIVGDFSFLSGCYGRLFFIKDLTPNIGIYWYFLVEVFDQFRTFFLFVFQIATFMFMIPVGIVYKRHPVFGILSLQIIVTVFKAYPTIADIALYMAFVPMYRETFSYMSHVFVIFSIYIFVAFLEPLFFYLWIYAGGNANFFYAITLVLLLGECILLLDLGGALRRRIWDIKNPELRRARVELARI